MPTTARSAIGNRLVAAMVERTGLSQRQLADRFKKSSGTITNWKLGDAQPSLEELAVICSELGVSADEILGLAQPAGGPNPRVVASVAASLDDLSATLSRLAQLLRTELP